MMNQKKDPTDIRFVFFGTPHLATVFLDELEQKGMAPCLAVTTPDRPAKRGLALTPPPVKSWAEARQIPVLQPEDFDTGISASLREANADVYVVIYYGKLLPKDVFDGPPHGTLNVHFSLLPRWKGTSPVRAAILNDDKELGISIVRMDEKIDHGPIVAQKKLVFDDAWPPRATEAEEQCTLESARLLAQILPEWLRGGIEARPQNHDLETWCPTLAKAEGLVSLHDEPYQTLLKIRAFNSTIGTYTFFERAHKKLRVQILDAHVESGRLVIDRVKPEGKGEMPYADFARSGAKPL